MRLQIEGETVSRICFDSALIILTDSGYELRIGAPAEIGIVGHGALAFEPHVPGGAATHLVSLVGSQVANASVSAAGALGISFDTGAELRVAADPDFEAWEIVGPQQERIICMPGGEVSTWGGSDA